MGKKRRGGRGRGGGEGWTCQSPLNNTGSFEITRYGSVNKLNRAAGSKCYTNNRDSMAIKQFTRLNLHWDMR